MKKAQNLLIMLEKDGTPFATKRKLKDGTKKKSAMEAIKYSREMLGKAKLKLSDLKKKGSSPDAIKDAQENLEFWKERIISLEKKLHEEYMNNMGTIGKKVIGIVEYLKNENWSKDSDSKEKSMQMMNELCKMDEELANDFIQYVDEACSNYNMSERLKK